MRQTFKPFLRALFGIGAALLGATQVFAAAPPRAPVDQWVAKSIVLKHKTFKAAELRSAVFGYQTVPFWTASITSPLDNQTYSISMVGSSPYAPAAALKNTNVTYVPIVVVIKFPDGTVFDPRNIVDCKTRSAVWYFQNSPLFVPAVYQSNNNNVSAGVVGGTQLGSAFQRANFYQAVKGSQYGVTLVPRANNPTATPAVVTVTLDSSYTTKVYSIRTACGKTRSLGTMDVNAYDNLIQSVMSQVGVQPNELPMILTYNVVWFDTTVSNCCILGYHSVNVLTGGAQTYAIGAFVDSGVFSGTDDVSVWSHELAEWMDDPFVQGGGPVSVNSDLTPAWGNIGQVQGCQNNLEVGDPLSGTEFSMTLGTGANAAVYHYQDLAFHDWFFRTKSTSAGYNYSFRGVLSTVQGAC